TLVQNVPAAGGMALANMVYSTAPKDGSYIGLVRGTVVQEQIYKDPQVQFDGPRFAWIGNMNSDYDSCIVWAASGIRSLSDFYARDIVVGASGAAAQSYSFPKVYDDLLGMKLKIIVGYPGTPERLVAMERGELTGACGISTSSLSSTLATPLKDGKIRIIAQAGAHKDPRYPNVPNILDEAKTPDVRQALEFMYATLSLGRPIAAPPETPPDRLAVLRRGLTATLKDSEFLQDAKTVGIDIEAADATATGKLVDQMFATPAPIVARIQAAMTP
ncbi:MAG TPA: tripartite tricarboxylate transporter substrate-binding protein, partial [Beijerinckiaceae bacterium]|nr:tripartite tricarboxylate transporter substrate-binding protein [Beijerinckiaceae bacterium]